MMQKPRKKKGEGRREDVHDGRAAGRLRVAGPTHLKWTKAFASFDAL